jgi:hypothetical protein
MGNVINEYQLLVENAERRIPLGISWVNEG